LVSVNMASVAAGAAGLTVILSLSAWAVRGSDPADVGTTAENAADAAEIIAAFPTFEERFFSGQSAAPLGSVAVKTVIADPVMTQAKVVIPTAPAPTRFGSSRVAPKQPAAPYRVASLSDVPLSDQVNKSLPNKSVLPKDAAPSDAVPSNSLPGDASHTAIYDISAHTVYLPDGERLEAHSGLGPFMDDAQAVNMRGRGPTPPNVYELTLRERRFHGVQAIRLEPVDSSKMYGRDGILAHSFMLGPKGESNGCVSFRDYPAFLNAYLSGEITRLVVVEQLDDPPGGTTVTDWLSNKLKGIFGRS
jgi:hypothetical protein